MLFEELYGARYVGIFLADCHIYRIDGAETLLAGVLVVYARLVYYCVEGDGGFARAAVADYELALPPAYGQHGVDFKYPRLQRLVDGLARKYARGDFFDGIKAVRGDFALAVKRAAERVYDPPKQPLAYGDAQQLSGCARLPAFLDVRGVAEQYAANLVLSEV